MTGPMTDFALHWEGALQFGKNERKKKKKQWIACGRDLKSTCIRVSKQVNNRITICFLKN